jgi:hypothetical protein
MFAEGHPNPEGLAAASILPRVLDDLVEELGGRGIIPERHRAAMLWPGKRRYGFAGIRRLDSAVDLRFDEPLAGLSALAGVASLPLPRVKTKVIRETGGRRVETVYLHGYSGKAVLGRWYDKGIESHSGDRGTWVRPEDQRRFKPGHRIAVEPVAESTFVRDAFVRRFQPLWQASKGVIVGSAANLGVRLGELVQAGEMSHREARSIAGHLVLEAAGVEEVVAPQSSRYRYRACARAHGLVLADGVLDEVEVDLHEVVEAALDEGAWGCG